MSTLVHLIYIHGFQGDDTSFQSFPKDLQEHLSSRIPPHLDIRFLSSLYPTYKCVKPISYATKNILEWLTTQPPGPVILLAHSMGGLLAAEAATHHSNNDPNSYAGTKPRRIVGVVAFDTPYLGMHPHVVISGISSLLPKEDKTQTQTTKAMNDHPQVKIVDDKVTDDWEAVKKEAHIHPGCSPYFANTLSTQSAGGPSRSSSQQLSRPHSPSPLVDGTLNFLAAYSDAPLVRWLRKHSDEPLTAGRRWIVERYQFGVSMFDPPGLTARYKLLTGWHGGKWVNYWTETKHRSKNNGTEHGNESEGKEHGEITHSRNSSSSSAGWADNDTALIANGIVTWPGSETSSIISSPSSATFPTKDPEVQSQQVRKEGKKSRALAKLLKNEEKETKKDKQKRGHHFVVLPHGIGERFGGMDKWECVEMGGVEDEVDAHLGLFMSGRNLDYEGLVDKVGTKILGWCEDLPEVTV